MSTAPAVQVEHVVKRFRRRRPLREAVRHPLARESFAALDGISLSVRPGECFGLLGENGAGKTTLFRLLATLLLPDRGTLTVHGADVVSHPELVRRLIAPVPPSERSLYWRLSGRQNLELFSALYGVPRAEASGRISELLDLVGLGQTGHEQVGAFSSGMRQRLLLARALLPRPRVLLLDEPTRSLDPVGARAFRRFLRERVLGAAGCTVLVATHMPEEVRELCDRVAVLHRGRLLAQGTTRELAAHVAARRWRVLSLSESQEGLAAFAARGGIVLDGPPQRLEEGGWAQEFDVTGMETSSILSQLVQAGIAVTGLERVDVPLADILERLVRDVPQEEPAHA